MKFVPKRPTFDEIVDAHGGIENYLNDPKQVERNNGLNYHDISLIIENISLTCRKTGRAKNTVYKIKARMEHENQTV